MVVPWTCAACERDAPDQGPCPGCGATKTSWTVIADRTRTLSVALKRVTLERGLDVATRPPGDPALAAVRLEPATSLPSLTRADAADVAALGHLPATADTLFVAVKGAGAGKPVDVTLEVLCAAEPSREVVLSGPVPADGHVKVLFVHGPDAGPLAFDGVHVVDVGEPTPEAVAPTVEVSALGCPPLAVQLVPPGVFQLSL